MVFEMKHITKTYDSVVANDDVSLHLNRGEILSIVGENGAGKSTIMKILYGLEKPDSGEIIVGGKTQRFNNPSDAMAVGIGMVQQHFMLFEQMTVAENIVFKNELKNGPFMDMNKTAETVRQISERYELKIDPLARIADCPEVEALLETIRGLARAGKSIVLITHKLQEGMAVSDRVYVMRQGRVVAERMAADTDISELAMLMVGHPLASYEIDPPKPGETLLETRGLRLMENGREVLKDISLHVNAGEIVGIAGVSGNGQSALIRCITGLEKSTGGQVLVGGVDVTNRSVREIRDAGLAHISEDRYVWGSAPEGTLEENALMARQDDKPFSSRGIIRPRAIRDFAVKEMPLKQGPCWCDCPEMGDDDIPYYPEEKWIPVVENHQKGYLMFTGEALRWFGKNTDLRIANPDIQWRLHPYDPPLVGYRGAVQLINLWINEYVRSH